jgi:hypothetical protein
MEDALGPLAILYCWQSCVLALGVTTGTHGVKHLIDYLLGGKEERKKRLFFNSIVLPATPIILGAGLAVLVPLWPEALIEYLKAHSIEGWKAKMAYAGYGAAVGQFADYVWHRYSSLIDGVKAKNAAAAEAAPAVLPAPAADLAPAAPSAPAADPAAAPSAPPTIPPVA